MRSVTSTNLLPSQLNFVENAASVVLSLQRRISTVSPTRFAATTWELPSVGDFLSSIDQFSACFSAGTSSGFESTPLKMSYKKTDYHQGSHSCHWVHHVCSKITFLTGTTFRSMFGEVIACVVSKAPTRKKASPFFTRNG
jgi:hypothetical protein